MLNRSTDVNTVQNYKQETVFMVLLMNRSGGTNKASENKLIPKMLQPTKAGLLLVSVKISQSPTGSGHDSCEKDIITERILEVFISDDCLKYIILRNMDSC